MDNQEQLSSKGNVSERLLKGMTEEERDAFTSSYNRAKRVLRKLNEYATKRVEVTDRIIDSPEGMQTSPNWQYLVAWNGGYRTAMRTVQDLTRT